MIRQVEDFPWEGRYAPSLTASLLSPSETTTRAFTQRFYEVRRHDGEIILAVGVAVWSFVRKPELWVALAEPFTERLRESFQLTREALALPAAEWPDLICEVHKDDRPSLNFAKRIGWRPTGEACLRPGGEDFIQFEVAR